MKKLTDKEKDKLLKIFHRILGEAIDTIQDCMTNKENALYARWEGDEEMYEEYKNS